MSKETLTQFFKSKLFAGIIVGVCIMLVVICIFEAGVIVGYHEAEFSSNWGQNYGQNFGNAKGMNEFGLPDGHDPSPDGTLGKIISIEADPSASSTTIVMSSTQKPEEKILIDSNTIIRNHENTISVSSLSVGTYVVVLGTPNSEGVIEAKLIRVVPDPGTEPAPPATNNS